MAYAEILRARRALSIYAIVIGGIVAITLLSWFLSGAQHAIHLDGSGAIVHVDQNGRHVSHMGQEAIPFSVLVLGAAYFATIIASIVGSWLSSERAHISQAWTKPISREGFALSYMAVDVVTALCAFAIFLFAECFTLWAIGLGTLIHFDSDVLSLGLLGLGFTFAYYGVVRSLGVAFGRGGLIAGISWPIGFVLAGLAAVRLPWVLHDIILVLNFINPIAYLTGFTGERSASVLPIPFEARVACEWLLAVITTAASVIIWKRLED
jgi:hypothetical protein